MKKTMKRIITLVLCLTMIFLIAAPSFAVTEQPTDNYSFLLAQGYKPEFLNRLTEEFMDKMVEVIGDDYVAEINSAESALNLGGIDTLDISAGDMNFQVDSAAICKINSNAIGTILVTITWEWAANKPLYRGRDLIAVNWEQSVLRFTKDGFYSQDLYRSNVSDDWTIFKETTNPSKTAQGGLGFEADLKAFKKYVSGCALIVLAPKINMFKGTSKCESIHIDYGHQYSPVCGLTLDIAGFGFGLNWGPIPGNSISKTAEFKYKT